MLCFFFLNAGKCGLFFEEYGTYHKNAKIYQIKKCQHDLCDGA